MMEPLCLSNNVQCIIFISRFTICSSSLHPSLLPPSIPVTHSDPQSLLLPSLLLSLSRTQTNRDRFIIFFVSLNPKP